MHITVTVPATTANLGPGFDCLGLALALYNEVSLKPARPGAPPVVVEGEGASTLPADESNLAWQAVQRLLSRLDVAPPPFRLVQRNQVPIGSGLGSSAAAVVGGLLAANAWAGDRLTRAEILALATAIEGHPDNVAPALYGGLTLIVAADDELHVERLGTPPITAVVVLPDFDLPTARARAALPAQVPRADAIFNASHLGLLLQGLIAADYDKIGRGMADRLHQPYRLPLIPGMAAAFAAARAAGAAGVALSGAGPSLVALAADRHEAIAAAVSAAFAAAGLASRHWILPVDEGGSRLQRKSQT